MPLWVAGREDYKRLHREACPQGVDVPAALEAPSLVNCRCGATVLLVPVRANGSTPIVIRSGHASDGLNWIEGVLKVRNLGNPELEWTVPALPVTSALLSTIVASMHCIDASAPDALAKSSDEIAEENVRRICASLAGNLEPPSPEFRAHEVAHSLSRVPPIEKFVARVFRDGGGLASFFEDLTRDLPVGFGLLDLSATSLVRQRGFCEICVQIRKMDPLRCVLSDLTRLWGAILCRSCPQLGTDIYKYQCPFHFTEAFFPVFAGELAAGGVFGGQLVEEEGQRDQIASAAVNNVDAQAASSIPGLARSLRVSPQAAVEVVQSACRGLAGLTGATFREWCRAETHSGLRAGLITSASGSNVQQLVEQVCPLVTRYVDVTNCSIWLFDQDRVVLAATTAPDLFVRSQAGSAPKPTRSAGLVGLAFYKLGEGLTGLVAQTRESMRTRNATNEPGWRGKFSETPADSQFVAVPLLHESELFGVLRVSKHSDQAPITDEDFELLKHFSSEVSIAIHEKRLKEELEAKAEGFRLALVETGHEFRSPLQNILGYVSVLKSLLPNNPDLQHIGTSIVEESQRAKRQMETSLLFGTNVPFHFLRARLGELFEPCAQHYERRAAERNIHIIVWDSAKRLPEVEMDSSRIVQVITNVLDNAVNWSFQGERIHIRGEYSEKTVKFSVEDKGTGIPPVFHKVIFEQLFKRKVVDDSRRVVTGTGIGLKIVKRIIEAHRGEITVSSVPFLDDPMRQSPQDGHTVIFSITLPRRRD